MRLGIVAILLAGATSVAAADRVRRTESFDAGWRFHKGEAAGAEEPRFDDGSWATVDAPHDWSIQGPYDQANPTGRGGGYLPSGVAWYRKAFTLPADRAGRRVFVEFDGVMADSRVFINGYHVGHRPNGYVSFRYELTRQLRLGDGKPNLLAIRTDTTLQPASRWYTGQGLYRHVRLVIADPVHVASWGLFVSTPSVSSEAATVRIQTTVVNQSESPQDARVQTTILAPDGRPVAVGNGGVKRMVAGESAAFQEEIAVVRPSLWSLEDPALYRAVARVSVGGKDVDDDVARFGIRDAHFDADTGFWLNGKNFKLKGVCLHHDGGAVGAAVPLRVSERRLENLRKLGVNAIRTAHNPPAPEFLDLTDRMGFLVMDEVWDAWTYAKPHAERGIHLHFNEWWEADTRDTVLRDRNHPSVILWSAGNEIHDTPYPDIAKPILRGLVDVFHAADPTRPVTQALFRPNVSHDYENGLADMLDVVGQNYRENELVAAHQQKPTRKVVGTENQHSREAWLPVRDNAFMSGQFLWSGIDYLGEADWPEVTASSGLLDRTGEPRMRGYERQSWWTTEPMVRIVRRIAPPPPPPVDPGYEAPQPQRRGPVLVSDWTPADLGAHEEDVEVYSNAGSVELTLNNKSLGAQVRSADLAPRAWKVGFEPGVLRALASDGGRLVATHELKTAGKPSKLVLFADRARLAHEWDAVSHVAVRVVDDNGVVVPGADAVVRFSVTGPGALVAVDNGDNASHEPFQAAQRRAYQGRVLAIVRATAPSGAIGIEVSSPGLAGASVTLSAVPPTVPN